MQAQQSNEVNTMNDKKEETKPTQEACDVPVASDGMLGPIKWRRFRLEREPNGKQLLLHDGKDFARGSIGLSSSAGPCDSACDVKALYLTCDSKRMDLDSIIWCADFEDMHARMLGMRPRSYVGWF